MKGVLFGSLHSFTEWGLFLSSKEIGSPAVKERTLDIEGADGELDMTEFFGGVNYGNRTLKFTFTAKATPTEFITLYTQIQNAIHGQKMQIILDDDPAFFYYGRVHISDFTNQKNIGTLNIECNCEPYKQQRSNTVVSRTISGTQQIILPNGRKKVVPTITTSASMTFAFNGFSVTRNAGTFRIPELQLIEGNNTVTVTGNGTVTFVYKEGEL